MPIIRSLARRKLRTALTVLGMAVGIWALVVMSAMANKLTTIVDRSSTDFDNKIVVTDPGGPSPDTDLDFAGVYRVSPDLSSINLLVRDFVLPNGLAFSPDESVLYINDSQGLLVRDDAMFRSQGRIDAFDVRANGMLANRRACGVLTLSRASHRYRGVVDEQAALKMRIRDLAQSRVSYGYRRLHVLLKRQGWAASHKRVEQIGGGMG